jgi:hypothetical protein
MRRMRRLALAMAAGALGSTVVVTTDAAVIPIATCRVSVEVTERLPLAWRPQDWRTFRDEAARPWGPYAVDLCWRSGAAACAGAGETVFVAIARETPSRTGASGDPLGWFGYSEAHGPGRLIVLAADAARRQLARSLTDGRPVGSPRGRDEGSLLARALGRTLAHELGHYLLRSRAHARTGLMRPSFTPDDLVLARPGARLVLSEGDEQLMARRCGYAVPGSLARAALEP